LLSERLDGRIFALGSYIGEVVRRQVGGEWLSDESGPDGEINVTLELPGGTLCWPIERAMKRFYNGSEDGIAFWGETAISRGKPHKA
jgi:hypothetical protein